MTPPSDPAASPPPSAPDADIRAAKREIRKKILRERDAIPYSGILSAALAIREHLRAWEIFHVARCVCCYVSVRSEISTAGIILRALESGKMVIVPRVFGAEMHFFRIKSLTDDLSKGTFGVLEPVDGSERVEPARADVCIVPGTVFDECGNRIGYGKGYYDRFLRALPPSIPTVGLAYDCQVLPAVPASGADVPVQFIATPSRGVFHVK